MSAPDFIHRVSAKEAAFARALAGFGYTVEATVQTLQGETVDGEFRHKSTLGFDSSGSRREVAEGSLNTLTRIKFADRDIDALRDAFVLTADRVSAGDIVYSGRQRVGEINASLFDVLPRDAAADVRGFVGRTWVRGREDAVMRLCGRSSSSPIAPMRFQVLRAHVAEQYWFPVSIRADEHARIGDETVHVRVTVKYSDYKARLNP
ncbi:MAG: hypothetical protein KIS73_22255 [Enhydrobacter sp.]|nr:hypothetical protein [Enhydrobacter sp.]